MGDDKNAKSSNSLIDGNYIDKNPECNHWAQCTWNYSSLVSIEGRNNKQDRENYQRSQSRNRSISPFRNSENSLISKKSCLKKNNYSQNSSFEKEKEMYDSLPNSRVNSKNRSSVVRSKIEIITKSPILPQINSKNFIHPQSFQERPQLVQVRMIII